MAIQAVAMLKLDRELKLLLFLMALSKPSLGKLCTFRISEHVSLCAAAGAADLPKRQKNGFKGKKKWLIANVNGNKPIETEPCCFLRRPDRKGKN